MVSQEHKIRHMAGFPHRPAELRLPQESDWNKPAPWGGTCLDAGEVGHLYGIFPHENGGVFIMNMWDIYGHNIWENIGIQTRIYKWRMINDKGFAGKVPLCGKMPLYSIPVRKLHQAHKHLKLGRCSMPNSTIWISVFNHLLVIYSLAISDFHRFPRTWIKKNM